MLQALANIDWTLEVTRYGLVLLRVGSLVVFCPILGAELLPAQVRIALALALALLLAPLAPDSHLRLAGPEQWVIASVRELCAGFSLGIAARVLFAAVEGAGGIVAGQSGFSLASMVDPFTGAESQAPMMFQALLATALFLSADLHHIFVKGIMHSYEVLPPGVTLPAFSGMREVTSLLGTRLWTVAVQLAGPALVVSFAVDAVLELVGRATPRMQIFTFGYPVKMAAGLIAMVVLTSATGAALGWMIRAFTSDSARLVAAFAAR